MVYGKRAGNHVRDKVHDVAGRQADIPGLRRHHEQHEDRGHGQEREREGAHDLTNHVALKNPQFDGPRVSVLAPGQPFRDRQQPGSTPS